MELYRVAALNRTFPSVRAATSCMIEYPWRSRSASAIRIWNTAAGIASPAAGGGIPYSDCTGGSGSPRIFDHAGCRGPDRRESAVERGNSIQLHPADVGAGADRRAAREPRSIEHG